MSPRRVRFTPVADDPVLPEPVPRLGPVVFSVMFPEREEIADLSGLPCPRLVRALAAALADTTRPKGLAAERSEFRGVLREVSRFVRFVAAATPEFGDELDLDDLEPEILDAYEQKLIADYAEGSSTPYAIMSDLVKLLRHVRDASPTAFDLAFQARLNISAVEAGWRGKPLDAYPPTVFEAFENAALTEVGKIRDRILRGERLAAAGQDPNVHGWRRLENILWYIDRHGPLTPGQRSQAVIKMGGMAALNEHLFLSSVDFLSFQVLIGCQTGMEPECVTQLLAQCLASPSRGFVSLQYLKRRSHGSASKTMRVRDSGNLRSPGGVLRLALRLTQRGRDLTGSKDLWVLVNRLDGTAAGVSAKRNKTSHHRHAWLAAYGIDVLDDRGGKKVKLDLRRLRKSFKSKKYLEAGGILPDFVSGHTPQVAGRHYADIGAHEEIHDQTVEAGLTQALAVALPPPVVLDEDGSRLDEGTAEVSAEVVRDALAGATDVWLSACQDFFNSPYALKKGAACPVPPWVCLECPNAVFTTRHLPALDTIERQREDFSTTEWTARFGIAHERIIKGVLARFRAQQISNAQAIAEADGPRLALPATFLEMIA